MASSSAIQTGAIISLLCLVLFNLFTLHYIINQNAAHLSPDDQTPSVHRVIDTDHQSQAVGPQTPVQQPRTEIIEKIPRIVHLSWKTEKIPHENVKWVQRWKETNPNWDIWFWSDASARQFITAKFPQYVPVFDRYRTGIFRADAMRYLILYEFGGVWADLDIEPLKSLDPLREKYATILSQESEVHAKIGWRMPQMICNAFMATRRHHPFFHFLVQMLEVNQKDNHPVAATGPVMLTRMYYAYHPLYEALGEGQPSNEVHIATTNMFLPTVDSLAMENLSKHCKDGSISAANRYLCDKYITPTFKNGPTEESYTDHHWWHSWLSSKDYKIYIPINTIIPNVVFPEKSGKF